LPGITEFIGNRPFYRRINICIFKDDVRRVAPSSMETFFMVSAALRTSVLPTAVDPVKEILRTSWLAMIASLISDVFPATAFSTPSGTPAFLPAPAAQRH
jgi:hypothetical protein